MLRLVFVIFLLWFSGEVTGQGVTITKSADIIVIRGKSFYLHTVQPGQTFYSICKVYGVDLEEVKVLNDKKDNSLSLYEVVKIPYVEPYVEKDAKFYYHKVAKGETLYSIARYFGIKPKRLLKYNENYSNNEPLSVGAVIKLPLDEIDQSALKRESGKQMVEIHPAVLVEKESPKKDNDIAEKIITQPSEAVITVKKTEEPGRQPEISSADMSQSEIKKEIPEYISEVILPNDPFVKIALLLPFSAKDYPVYDTISGMRVEISQRSEQFVSFYEGILLAADSLKSKGYKIDLRVFDTERSVEKMHILSDQINQLQPDLIIGPVYGSVYKVMADNLQNKDIPMVYPLSSRSESFGEYPNFIQVNASLETLAAKMVDWLKIQRANANIISISLKTMDDDTDASDKRIFREYIKQIEGVTFFNWNVVDAPLDALRSKLLPDRENIIILPTIKEADVSKVLPVLSALADGYRITVIGFPEWQTFTSVDHEAYYKLNTKIFTYSYIDNSSDAACRLIAKYRKYFYTEPNSLVFKAFDMGIYFMEMAAKYRDRTLEAIDYYGKNSDFSSFHFDRMAHGVGKENHGFFIVNFGSDYQLKIEALK